MQTSYRINLRDDILSRIVPAYPLFRCFMKRFVCVTRLPSMNKACKIALPRVYPSMSKTQGQPGGMMTKRRKKKLLDRVRDAIQAKHYSIRTEQAYAAWIKRYILLSNKWEKCNE